MRHTTKLMISLDNPHFKALKREGKNRGVSLQTIVRLAISDFLLIEKGWKKDKNGHWRKPRQRTYRNKYGVI